MTTSAKAQLSASQQQILNHAAVNTDGKLVWFPETLKGGAKAKAIESLVSHGLISQKKRETVVTKAGYEALGLKPPVAEPRTVRTRETSKQATVINMLKRVEGATIEQICQTTGWQAHTVRGTFAGAFKKKLGLEITSSKADGSERTYRITTN